jgi:hypothetical protein
VERGKEVGFVIQKRKRAIANMGERESGRERKDREKRETYAVKES